MQTIIFKYFRFLGTPLGMEFMDFMDRMDRMDFMDFMDAMDLVDFMDWGRSLHNFLILIKEKETLLLVRSFFHREAVIWSQKKSKYIKKNQTILSL